MGLGAYLCVSAALLVIGLVMVIARRNLIYVLMGLELVLNAANLNFVAFNRFNGMGNLDGQISSLFVIVLAAAEAAVALAIVLNIFGQTDTVRPDQLDNLRD